MITKVQLPMARPAIVLAANQGLLYVLSMVVIGGMVGAGGLGYIVVSGFSQGQLFGKGLAAGIAITALGVMVDRIASTPQRATAADHQLRHDRGGASRRERQAHGTYIEPAPAGMRGSCARGR